MKIIRDREDYKRIQAVIQDRRISNDVLREVDNRLKDNDRVYLSISV